MPSKFYTHEVSEAGKFDGVLRVQARTSYEAQVKVERKIGQRLWNPHITIVSNDGDWRTGIVQDSHPDA